MSARPTPEKVPVGTTSGEFKPFDADHFNPDDLDVTSVIETSEVRVDKVTGLATETVRGRHVAAVTVTMPDGSHHTIEGLTATEITKMGMVALQMAAKMIKMERTMDGTLVGTDREGLMYELRDGPDEPGWYWHRVSYASPRLVDWDDETVADGDVSFAPVTAGSLGGVLGAGGLSGLVSADGTISGSGTATGWGGLVIGPPYSTAPLLPGTGTRPLGIGLGATDPAPESVQINFRASHELKHTLKVKAAKAGMKLGDYLTKLLEERIAQTELDEEYAAGHDVFCFEIEVTRTPAAEGIGPTMELIGNILSAKGYKVGTTLVTDSSKAFTPPDPCTCGTPVVPGVHLSGCPAGYIHHAPVPVTHATYSTAPDPVACTACGSTRSGMHLVGCYNAPCPTCNGYGTAHDDGCVSAACLNCGKKGGEHHTYCSKYVAPPPFRLSHFMGGRTMGKTMALASEEAMRSYLEKVIKGSTPKPFTAITES